MLRLIWKYLKKYWYIAILAPLFMIGEVAMDFVLSIYMEKMIDFGIQTLNQSNILHYGLIMIGIVLTGVVFGVLSGVFTYLASYKAINDMRKDLFKKIMSLSYDQTDKFSTGSLVIRVTNDVTQIQQMINMTLRMMVRQIAMFGLGIAFTLNVDRRFGYVLLVCIPLEIILMLFALFKGSPYFAIMQKKIDRVNTITHENVTGARVVKAFNKEEHEIERFNGAAFDAYSVAMKVNKILNLIMPLLMLTIYIGQAAIYAIGGESIIGAHNSMLVPDLMVGQVNQAITYIVMICMSFMMFGMIILQVTRAMASSKRILEVLDCEADIADGTYDISNTLDSDKGTIEFNNVSFGYPGTNTTVLNNISFKVNKGDTIAIVGSTGSGKSSLVNLIARFYDVNEGYIKVDGIDVKDYKLADLRKIIAICLQKSELFAGTIADNVRWGKEDATIDEVLEAIEIAQAKEFVDSKENGLDEWVEEKGSSLSGGQKQRLAIARAIIKKPEIIIFDDSTSALDLVTESKLYKAMKNTISDVTKVVVAQRIATAKNADKIIVLDNGKIVAFDTHVNLMKNCELYQDIYNSQLSIGED